MLFFISNISVASVARKSPASCFLWRGSVSGAWCTRWFCCGDVGSGEQRSERPSARVARPAGCRAARRPEKVLAVRRVAHVLLLQLLRAGRAGAAGRSERQGAWKHRVKQRRDARSVITSFKIFQFSVASVIIIIPSQLWNAKEYCYIMFPVIHFLHCLDFGLESLNFTFIKAIRSCNHELV